jgi:O-antigen ligase
MVLKVCAFLNKWSEKIIFTLFSIWTFSPLITLLLSRINIAYKHVIWYSILSIIGILLLILSILKIIEKKDYKKFIPIFLFLIWATICCFASSNTSLAIYGNDYRGEGLITYFLYTGYFINAFYLSKEESILKLMKILSISAFLFCLFQHILGPIENGSLFYQFNHFGYYLMISSITNIFVFLIEKKLLKKILYFIIYLFLLYELIINNTFGSYLALFITLLLYFFYLLFTKKPFKSFLLILFSFFLLSFLVEDENHQNIMKNNFIVFKTDIVAVVTQKDEQAVNQAGTSRGLLWKKGIEFVLEKPILGYGLEGVEGKYKQAGISIDRPHNSIIQTALFTGIPGMLIYVCLMAYLFIQNLLHIKQLEKIEIAVCFIAGCYCLSSMFGNSMFYTTPYYLIFLGFVMQNVYRKEFN